VRGGIGVGGTTIALRKLDLRALVGWRRLPAADRDVITRHRVAAATCFASLESSDPHATLLAEAPLIDLPGRGHLDRAGPAELLSARVAAAAELREIPLHDDGRRVSLFPVRTYRRHLAALRILEVTDPLELPWDHNDVRALFSIALNPKGATAEQAQYQFDIPPGFPPFAAQQLITRLVSPVRLDLHTVAIQAAERLGAELPESVTRLMERARTQIVSQSTHAFNRDELVERLDRLLTEVGA